MQIFLNLVSPVTLPVVHVHHREIQHVVHAQLDFTYNGSDFRACFPVLMDYMVMVQLTCAYFAITRAKLAQVLDQTRALYVPNHILEVHLFASRHANRANSMLLSNHRKKAQIRAPGNAYLAIKNV